MRHGKTFNHLGRTASHRKALLANMASSLILKKRIETTLAKAKELRKYVEPLLTKSKEDTTHSRRTVFAYLKNKESVKELFGEVANKIAERAGGYTRIIKLGNRLGDAAEVCIIELVDFNETMLQAKTDVKRTRRGRRKGKGEQTEQKVQTENTTAEVLETKTAENVVPVAEVTEPIETLAQETVSDNKTEEENPENPENNDVNPDIENKDTQV